MTPEAIIGVAAAVLALLFMYIPGFKDWYGKKTGETKQLIMLGLLLLTVAGVFGLGCAGQIDAFTCDVPGVWDAVFMFVMAIVVNQGVYKGLDYVRTGKENGS